MNNVTAEQAATSLVVQEVVEEDSSVELPDELGPCFGQRKLDKSSFVSKTSKRRNVKFDAEELLFEKLFPECADREPEPKPSGDPSFKEF